MIIRVYIYIIHSNYFIIYIYTYIYILLYIYIYIQLSERWASRMVWKDALFHVIYVPTWDDYLKWLSTSVVCFIGCWAADPMNSCFFTFLFSSLPRHAHPLNPLVEPPSRPFRRLLLLHDDSRCALGLGLAALPGDLAHRDSRGESATRYTTNQCIYIYILCVCNQTKLIWEDNANWRFLFPGLLTPPPWQTQIESQVSCIGKAYWRGDAQTIGGN